MSVLCIGQCGYDMIYCIPGRVEENQKSRVQETYELPGGPAACAAAVTGSWGLATRLVTHIGDDLFSDAILCGLKHFSVDISYVQKLPNTKSSRSVILLHSDNGNRTIFNDPGTILDWELSLPKDADVILMDSHETASSHKALETFPFAVSILDGGTARDYTVALAQKADYLVCSESFASGFTGNQLELDKPETLSAGYLKLCRLTPRTVITLGSRGLLYRQGANLMHLPALNVNCKDTLGAGDIFHGAFAYGIHEKMKMEEILKFASAAAGLSVTKTGGMSSIPAYADVLACLKEQAKTLIPHKIAELQE